MHTLDRTGTTKKGKPLVWLAGTGWLRVSLASEGDIHGATSTHNPELKPFCSGVHGASKDDCVTEWFFGWNSKRMKSPLRAFYDHEHCISLSITICTEMRSLTMLFGL